MSDATFPPHSHPFRMIDVILEIDRERCTTIKAVSGDEVVQDDPEVSGGTYPLSLLLEAMAQAAIPLAGLDDEEHPHTSSRPTRPNGMIVGIDEARLLRPVSAGDRLLITATIVGRHGAMIRVRSVAEIAARESGRAVVAEGEFTIALEGTA